MVVGGCISLAWGIVAGAQALPVCLGCTLIIFGIVEVIRSKSIRERNKRRKESEMDAYLRIASSMGIVVNPITQEVVSKKKDQIEDNNVQEETTYSEKDVQEEKTDAIGNSESENSEAE